MANTPCTTQLSRLDDESLFAILRDLETNTRRNTAARVIAELRGRSPKNSLNKIAENAGLPRITVQRWASLPLDNTAGEEK